MHSNLELRNKFFPPVENPYAPHDDALTVTTADGKMLLHMRTWTMTPESAEVAKARRAPAMDTGCRPNSTRPPDEHYYGLGQQQKGWMDLRDHEIHCWHEYSAIGGEDVCVPFMVSSRGYGLVWDNPSKTTVDLGFQRSAMCGRRRWETASRTSSSRGNSSDRDLRGISDADRRNTDAAEGGVRVHPEQGDLSNPGHRYWTWRKDIATRICLWMWSSSTSST